MSLITLEVPSARQQEESPEVTGMRLAREALAKVFKVPGLTYSQRLKHAKELNTQLATLEYHTGVSQLHARPQNIELPVAGKCNLRCTMCGLSHGDPGYPNWTIDEVRRFEPLFRTALCVNPTGAGEPLSNHDLFSMLELFAGYELNVGFFTNATLLTPERAERIIRLGVDQLNISIDGATAATFENIRRHAKFDTVIKNTRGFVQKRRELGRTQPRLQIAMVLMQENIHELPDLVRLAADLGADSIYTMFVSDLVPEQMCERDPQRTNHYLREARAVAAGLKIPFRSPTDLPETLTPGRTHREKPALPAVSRNGHACVYPWSQLVIWNDGAASPCCRIRDEVDGHSFGNIHHDEPEALWNSPGMVHLRERLASGKMPHACRVCPLRTLHMGS